MNLLYILFDFLAGIIFFNEVINVFKHFFSLKKLIVKNFNPLLILEKIRKRVFVLFMISIVTLFLSMIPFEKINNIFFKNLSEEQSIHLYLIIVFIILDILIYSLYKIIKYEKFKEKYIYNKTKISKYKFDKNKIIEKVLKMKSRLTLKEEKIYIKQDIKVNIMKNIFLIIFMLISFGLIVFLGLCILDIKSWSKIDKNTINGIQYLLYAFLIVISMMLGCVGIIFSKSYINLKEKTIERTIFYKKSKVIFINNGETRVKELYYKNIYIGMLVYFYNNYIGEIPLIISKDNRKIIEILNFLKELTNENYKFIGR